MEVSIGGTPLSLDGFFHGKSHLWIMTGGTPSHLWKPLDIQTCPACASELFKISGTQVLSLVISYEKLTLVKPQIVTAQPAGSTPQDDISMGRCTNADLPISAPYPTPF